LGRCHPFHPWGFESALTWNTDKDDKLVFLITIEISAPRIRQPAEPFWDFCSFLSVSSYEVGMKNFFL